MERENELRELLEILVEMAEGSGYVFEANNGTQEAYCLETGEIFDVGKMLAEVVNPIPEGTYLA